MIEENEIGKRIRQFRKKKGMTLQELAEKSGFTKSYISKIENSEKAPPVSTLILLAKTLQVRLSELIGEVENSAPICVVKKNERYTIVRDGTVFGYAYHALAHKFLNKHMEPYILVLPKEVKENVLFQHKGEEMLFVLEGTMKFFYGNDYYILEEGDCVYFDSSIPHYGVCVGDKEVKCLMVIYTPE